MIERKLVSFVFVVALSVGIVGCNSEPEAIVIETDIDEVPDEPIVGDGSDPGKQASTCYPSFAENQLNVVTWNIERFPIASSTVIKVRSIIENLDADIIAVQEITDPDEFLALGALINGWNATYSDVGGSIELGYFYKVDAFRSFGTLSELTIGSSYSFPREPVVVTATHASGLEVTFINIHLKCCGEFGSTDYDRRLEASEQLKEYIDKNLSDQAVIVLGDWNDDLQEVNTPFENFIADDENYLFADMEIALGSSVNFSYPSWPSHLDHILITDELFEHLDAVMTINPNDCVDNYPGTVSDHRPVLASFSN